MPVPKYYSLKMTGFGVKPVIGSDFCLGTVCTYKQGTITTQKLVRIGLFAPKVALCCQLP